MTANFLSLSFQALLVITFITRCRFVPIHHRVEQGLPNLFGSSLP
jgi:hypothetical protein